MITLSLKDSGAVLGTISEADFKILVDFLEEESETDADYYITGETIDMLERDGAGSGLVALLREAVGDSEGVDIVWTAD